MNTTKTGLDTGLPVINITEPVKGEFNAGTRCDTCRAQAFTSAIVNGQDLYYCGHHFTKYEDNLRAVASEIIDRRDLINIKPSQSSPD